MAQRSARARSKLDKITAANGGPTSPQRERRPTFGGHGGARLGSGGLLTPSASSVSGSSTRNSLQLQPPQRIGKGALRSFFDAQGEKLRGRLPGHQRKDTNDGTKSFYSGLGGGFTGMGHGNGGGFGGLSGLSTIGEERVQVKRWEGSGSRGEPWHEGGKGKKDVELWFPDGDTLVYLTDKPLASRNPEGLYKPPTPQPSFRLRSSVLRKTESPYLISLLDESFRERPPTPAQDDEIYSLQQTEEQLMDYEYQLRRTKTRESAGSINSQGTAKMQDSAESGIMYRMYFPAPSRLDKAMKHRYHLTTRNFFAMLFNQSLVGVTLGQTLLELTERTDKYLCSPSPMEYEMADRGLSEIESPYGSFLSAGSSLNSGQQAQQPPHPNTQRMIIDYLQNREFGDVRKWPEGAAGLVVWSERIAQRVAKQGNLSTCDERLESLWREGFVHCTGLLTSLQLQPEWGDISPITKALIDRASLEIQVRVSNADQRMSGFHFNDMWPVSSAGSPPARLAFDRFQKFLMKHYTSRFTGTWPPNDGKFTRTVYLHLQRDFATLYSYIVDHDAVWSPAHDQSVPSGSRRTIVKPALPNWRADDESLQMTDILSGFDERENHPPIPHPFPLVPPTNTPATTANTSTATKKQKGFFPTTGPRNRAYNANPGAALAALALSESTNIEALKSSTTSNPLLEAFQSHEKSIPAHEISPHDARKGRWIMIYGVLQTLASVAVDAPGVTWTEGVEYWINPKLRGTPPWKTSPHVAAAQEEGDERSHFRSHCWVSKGPQEVVAAVPVTLSPGVSARIRQRSRSRSRKQLRALHREQAAATAAAAELEAISRGKENNSSGDEGDDEMDAGESEAATPPPPSEQQRFGTWGQRHVMRGGMENPGIMKSEVTTWAME
ncbi:hypothetical protein BDD12DRAFT_892605 [Trichophaea hybrida]|nr:hypothetical protein BDD12DRAFT_892605 [Trichophaea hybrida]